MYLDFFKLEQHPFQIAPDAHFLYLSRQHARAIAYMKYAVLNHEGFAVITGQIGSGKTTLIQKLLSDIDDAIKIVRITQSQLDSLEFLYSVLRGLGVEPKSEKKVPLLDEIRKALDSLRQKGINTLVIVDDAQNLSNQVLEEIRLLSDSEAEHGGSLSIILVGQPELEQRLKQTGLTQLDQRVRLRFRLGPLNKEETDLYIQYRMNLAGWEGPPLFNPEICQRVFDYTCGTPRLINILCDSLLLGAFVDETRELTMEMVDASAKELEMTIPAIKPAWDSAPPQSSSLSNASPEPSPQQDQHRVDIYMHGELVEEFHLEGNTTTIGRTSDNDIQLAHPSVSQYHALLVRAGHRSFIIDLDSEHGTLVTGKPILRHTLEMEPVFIIDPYTLVLRNPAVEAVPEGGGEKNSGKEGADEKGRLKTVGS